jgi:hypothetical protein
MRELCKCHVEAHENDEQSVFKILCGSAIIRANHVYEREALKLRRSTIRMTSAILRQQSIRSVGGSAMDRPAIVGTIRPAFRQKERTGLSDSEL